MEHIDRILFLFPSVVAEILGAISIELLSIHKRLEVIPQIDRVYPHISYNVSIFWRSQCILTFSLVTNGNLGYKFHHKYRDLWYSGHGVIGLDDLNSQDKFGFWMMSCENHVRFMIKYFKKRAMKRKLLEK